MLLGTKIQKQGDNIYGRKGNRNMATCKECKGKGAVPCPDCKGKGKKDHGGIFSNDWRECKLCGGSGKKKCGVCNGKGTVP